MNPSPYSELFRALGKASMAEHPQSNVMTTRVQFSTIDDSLTERVIDSAYLKTTRGLQLHLLALAEKRYGKAFSTKPDSSMCGFRVVADNGECLGLATANEMEFTN